MTWHKLAMLTDIPDAAPLEKEARGLPLALFKVRGKVYCTGNLCTHAEAFLSDGYLDGFEIECPLHGARFDIRDGRVLCQPARKDIASYPVRLDGTDVLVELP
ncbi:MAG: non-heme iron oxygenase ferredoxin subunit [Acidobacteriota bacterium]